MEPNIIYEDESLLVLDKLPGWIVNDATTTKGQPTVQEWIARNFKFQISNDKLLRSGIVHRLDKETSGILVVAKTKEAFENLQRQFKSRQVEKIYIALVHGRVDPEKGSIEVPVGRLPWRRDRFGILPGGRISKTAYKVLSEYKRGGESFSLVEVTPQTGRTHQIRIHFKYLGHPVVSDEFYAGRKTSRADRKWCPRLFLHATTIEFFHPKSGQKVKFSLDLPDDLDSVLDTLEKLRETN